MTTARSQSTDPFNANRFHVTDLHGSFLNLSAPSAGFSTSTSPEMTLGVVEYQEGIEVYRRKYPGEVTFGTWTLGKGMMKNDTTFYSWVMAGVENRPYRTDIVIAHYHRDDVSGLVNYAGPNAATPSRKYILFNAFATRVKLGQDFDSTAADVSVEDMDMEYEYFRMYDSTGAEVQATVVTG